MGNQYREIPYMTRASGKSRWICFFLSLPTSLPKKSYQHLVLLPLFLTLSLSFSSSLSPYLILPSQTSLSFLIPDFLALSSYRRHHHSPFRSHSLSSTPSPPPHLLCIFISYIFCSVFIYYSLPTWSQSLAPFCQGDSGKVLGSPVHATLIGDSQEES